MANIFPGLLATVVMAHILATAGEPPQTRVRRILLEGDRSVEVATRQGDESESVTLTFWNGRKRGRKLRSFVSKPQVLRQSKFIFLDEISSSVGTETSFLIDFEGREIPIPRSPELEKTIVFDGQGVIVFLESHVYAKPAPGYKVAKIFRLSQLKVVDEVRIDRVGAVAYRKEGLDLTFSVETWD